MTQIQSEGYCIYCNQLFTKRTINRHLNKHLAEILSKKQTGLSFHIRIEPRYNFPEMFLNILVDGDAVLDDVDLFLRQIWLDCCGHMSSFKNPKKQGTQNSMFDMMDAYELLEQGTKAQFENRMEESYGELPSSRKTKLSFVKGLKLLYQYDFGSTTHLILSVVEEFPFKAGESITLLSRNEPLKILCDVCEKEPAVEICSVCYEENLLCSGCAKKHKRKCPDFADYAAMPVVNSPRMGVCGYDGGYIDKKRDKAFEK